MGRVLSSLPAALGSLLFVVPCAFGIPLKPGDLIVTDVLSRSVIHIDPLTGNQTVISSGGTLVTPNEVVVAEGQIFVSDQNRITRIDPETGDQTVVHSDGLLGSGIGMVFTESGDLLIVNGFSRQVIKIDSASGTQSIVAEGGVPDGFIASPRMIALEESGDILLADETGSFNNAHGALIRIDSASGSQTLLSSQGIFNRPFGIAVDPSGDILVADSATASVLGKIVRVDPVTGVQTIVSAGDQLLSPDDIEVDADRNVIVVDSSAFFDPATGANGTVFRIDPVSGTQTIVSEGGHFRQIRGLAIVPIPQPSTSLLVASGLATLAVQRRRRSCLRSPPKC